MLWFLITVGLVLLAFREGRRTEFRTMAGPSTEELIGGVCKDLVDDIVWVGRKVEAAFVWLRGKVFQKKDPPAPPSDDFETPKG